MSYIKTHTVYPETVFTDGICKDKETGEVKHVLKWQSKILEPQPQPSRMPTGLDEKGAPIWPAAVPDKPIHIWDGEVEYDGSKNGRKIAHEQAKADAKKQWFAVIDKYKRADKNGGDQ